MSRFDSYKDEEQTSNNTRSLVGIGIGFTIFAIALIWLSFKVSRQVAHMKSNFRIYIKRGLIGFIILTCVVGFIFIVLNSIGKKKSYDKHYVEEEINEKSN